MDDLAHDFHPLNRKRKADQDDCQSSHCQPQDGSPSVEAAAPCDSMLVDPAATPRCPASSPERSSTASWLLADTDVGIVPAWQQPLPSPSSTNPFVAESQKEGPSPPLPDAFARSATLLQQDSHLFVSSPNEPA